MRTDEKGLSAAEGILLVIIILLIISTGILVFAIREMGPDNEANLKIEDVYFKKNNSSIEVDSYVTNIGKPDADAEIRWTFTQGNRLLTEGSKSITVDGRKTYAWNFKIDESSEGELKVEVIHDGNVMDTYTKQL